MAQGCAGNGADVVEGLVTPRPWAVEVVTVATTAPTTGTTTSAGTAQDGRHVTPPSVGKG